MKMNKKILCVITSLLLFFTSCTDNEWTYEERLVGYYWSVDLNEKTHREEPLISEFYFAWDQFGEESKIIHWNNVLYEKISFDWYWHRYERNVLVLDYVNLDVCFIEFRKMTPYRLTAFFYANPEEFKNGRGISVVFNRIN